MYYLNIKMKSTNVLFYFVKIIYNYYGDNMKKGVILLICLVLLCSCGKNKNNNTKECPGFYSNKYKVIFNSNGGTQYETIEICDICERPDIDLLPEPTKKGYVFGGWYYDDLFFSKADVKTIDQLEPSIFKDEVGCDRGYKDINLYALWIKK